MKNKPEEQTWNYNLKINKITDGIKENVSEIMANVTLNWTKRPNWALLEKYAIYDFVNQ